MSSKTLKYQNLVHRKFYLKTLKIKEISNSGGNIKNTTTVNKIIN